MSPYLNGHFELFAHLDHPTGVFRSNGLPGVNNDDICCEAQCGKCGGPGCGGRPGGSVRWCLCRFRLLPWPLISLALSEACSFVCPGPRKRGKIAGTQSLTSRLASVWPENGHRSAPQHRQVRRAVVEPFTTACYVDTRRVRDEEVCRLTPLVFHLLGLGIYICFIAWL